MRKSFFYALLTTSIFFTLAISCKKGSSGGSGGGGGGGTEANLTVTLNPPENSVQPASPQTDFPLTVTVTSTMPAQGVTIDVSAKKDDGSGAAAFFTTSQNTTGSINNFTISGTPAGVVCLTTVTVTSRSKSTNKWTGTYRYSRKP